MAISPIVFLKVAPSPLLFIQILGGVLGVLFGNVALLMRKGSRLHRTFGTVFFASMPTMSTVAAFQALIQSVMINVIVGVLTFYLVATAWLTARRAAGKAHSVDYAALLVAVTVGVGAVAYGLKVANSPTPLGDGSPAGSYFFFGSVALFAAALDVRMLVPGGIAGAHGIARHLWRMCFALWIAATSLFLGQPQLFSDSVRKSNILFAPSVIIAVLLIFWLIRVAFTNPATRTRHDTSVAR